MLYKFVFLLTCVLYVNCFSFSQNSEKQLLKNIGENSIKQNDYYLLKQQLPGGIIVVDPVTGSQFVRLPSSANKTAVLAFNKYSNDQQIEILNTSKLPILPIADTIFIIDTLKFFSEDISFCKERFCFKIKRKSEIGSNHDKYMYLYAAGIRNNSLILSFSFKNSNELCNYYFDLKQDAFIFTKTLMLSKTPVME